MSEGAEARDGIPMPPGMSKGDFDAMVGADSDLTDMAATAKAIYDSYTEVGFTPSQAIYFSAAVLTGNPLTPGRN